MTASLSTPDPMTAARPLSAVAPAAEAQPVTRLAAAQADYAIVRRLLERLSDDWRAQPSVEDLADMVGLSADDTHRLFRRWCGLTPKAFLQAVTLDHARRLLRQGAPLLDAALELGLSGPGRLHDLFVTHDAMSPGEWKAGGRGLKLTYGFHPSPFGEALLIATDRGLAAIGWVDEKAGHGLAADQGKPAGGRDGALADMCRRWPAATFVRDDARTAPLAARIFDATRWTRDQPLRVVLIGSDFEIRVWQQLLRIPVGSATTYGAIASALERPRAARPVGAAIGRNPLSFVVPCHRVLGSGGALTGYHWGLTRKRAILGWEYGLTHAG